VLAATDESLVDGRISDRTWAACAEHLDEASLVELVAAIGNWTLFARLLPSLEVPLEDGVEPWPPDGRRPYDPMEETR
jgi:alkylhydroperoxidase family enzyme